MMKFQEPKGGPFGPKKIEKNQSLQIGTYDSSFDASRRAEYEYASNVAFRCTTRWIVGVQNLEGKSSPSLRPGAA